MPRKMAGKEINTIEASSDAMKMPSVVLDRAVHLYRSERPLADAATAPVATRTPLFNVHVKVFIILTSTSTIEEGESSPPGEGLQAIGGAVEAVLIAREGTGIGVLPERVIGPV